MDRPDKRRNVKISKAVALIILLAVVFSPLKAESIIKPPVNVVEINIIPPKKKAVGEKYVFKVKTNRNAYKVFIVINRKKYEMKGQKKTWNYNFKIKKSGTIKYKAYAVNKRGKQGKSKTGVLEIKVETIECGEFIGKNSQGYDELKSIKDGSTMVRISAGEFILGSNKYSDEKPELRVFLKGYCIDKFLVTNEQFKRFVDETQYQTDAEKEGYGMVRIGNRWKRVNGANWKRPDGFTSIEGKENHPVVQISYNDALRYCKWANKRLPTEAEWEKAARGPEGNKFPWGNSEPNDTMVNFDNFIGSTTLVDKYEKGQSFYGLYDMAGNVYQWCSDWYEKGHRANSNPKGPESGKERVIKGGSFIEGSESLRSANRDRYEPNYRTYLFGFRCAY